VRVRLLAAQDRVLLRGAIAPTLKASSEKSVLRLNLPPKADVELRLTDNTWQIGGVNVPGRGELTLWQTEDGSVTLNGRKYRGSFRFVPMGGSTFDVVNDVDVDGYVRGVRDQSLQVRAVKPHRVERLLVVDDGDPHEADGASVG